MILPATAARASVVASASRVGAAMSIKFSIDVANRLVYGFFSGPLSLAELAGFARDVVQADVLHYRKLFHVVEAKPTFTEREMTAMAQVLREQRTSVPRGPIAFVADPERGEIVRLFSSLDMEGRPAKVFRSVHDARKWLGDQAVVDKLPPSAGTA